MAGQVFSENEEVTRKNKSLPSRKKETTLFDFNKEQIKIIKINSTPKKMNTRIKYTHCRRCGDELTNFRCKVWGFCPLCDML